MDQEARIVAIEKQLAEQREAILQLAKNLTEVAASMRQFVNDETQKGEILLGRIHALDRDVRTLALWSSSPEVRGAAEVAELEKLARLPGSEPRPE